jgi:hypothetical protein
VLPQIDRWKDLHPSTDIHLYFGTGPDLVNRVRADDARRSVFEALARSMSELPLR